MSRQLFVRACRLIPQEDRDAMLRLYHVERTVRAYADFFVYYLEMLERVERCSDCKLYGHRSCSKPPPETFTWLEAFVMALYRAKGSQKPALGVFVNEFLRHDEISSYVLMPSIHATSVCDFLYRVYKEAELEFRLDGISDDGFVRCTRCRRRGHEAHACAYQDYMTNRRAARHACHRFRAYVRKCLSTK